MVSFKSFYAFSLAAALLYIPSAAAEPVAEWKFDQPEEVAGGGVVKMDRVKEGAKGEAILMDESLVSAAPTGLGKGWQDFLASGYLEVQRGSGESAAGRHGLATDIKPGDSSGTNYRSYMGFAGPGTGAAADGSLEGGTVYLVVSPQEWLVGARYGLFGTGHAGEGSVTLGISKAGPLALRVGTQADAVTASLSPEVAAETWYFIAGTWRVGEPLLLYVREMAAEGPGASPAAQTAVSATQVPETPQPEYDPIAFGANWYDPGANAATNDGSNSRIAWARLDNQFSTQAQIETVFQSLGARN